MTHVDALPKTFIHLAEAKGVGLFPEQKLAIAKLVKFTAATSGAYEAVDVVRRNATAAAQAHQDASKKFQRGRCTLADVNQRKAKSDQFAKDLGLTERNLEECVAAALKGLFSTEV